MPRAAKPARLWLRPAAKGRAATWLILDGGKQIATACGPEERARAEAALQKHLGRKYDPTAHGRQSIEDTPIADTLLIYRREVVDGSARPEKVVERINRLGEWWGDKWLSDVTPETCRAYVAHRQRQTETERAAKAKGKHAKPTRKPISGGGARRDLEDLRAAINHHARRGLHVGQVFVTLPLKGKPRTRYLTRDEVAKLLWVCWRHKREQVPPRGPRKGERIESYYDLRHLARFILMGIYTGSRSGPILKAAIRPGAGRAYLDLGAGLYHRLPEDMVEAANKKSPTVPIAPRLLAHLKRWRDRQMIAEHVVEWQGKPVQSIKTAWERAVSLAKLEGNPVPHTLRHTRVTWLKQDGVSSWAVGGYVGMSEQMVERVYGHHDPNFMAEVVESIGRRGNRRPPQRRPANASRDVPLAVSLPKTQSRPVDTP